MADRNNREFTFEIHERIAVLSVTESGWMKEVTLTSWNGGPAKLDIRSWSPDHKKMARGLTFTDEEALRLGIVLASKFDIRR